MSLFGFFRQATNSLIFLATACMLYGTPQVRELLWIRYGTILSEFDPYHSSYYSFFWLFYYKTLFSYSTLSLLLVAFCFIALNPDYRRSLWEKPTEASDPGRVSELLGYGLITSAVFLTIVVYNIIAVTFPYFPANGLLAYIAINVLGLDSSIESCSWRGRVLCAACNSEGANTNNVPPARSGFADRCASRCGTIRIAESWGSSVSRPLHSGRARNLHIGRAPQVSRLRPFELFE